MRTEREREEWLAQCRRQLQRDTPTRLRYGFARTHKPVLDDAPYRVFNSTAGPGRGARQICHAIWDIMPRPSEFAPLQAQELAAAFAAAGVDYLFIGKSGAILLGYPGVTQDVDLFLPDDSANSEKVIVGLERLGFTLDDPLRTAIRERRDFVQIKSGPFDVDLVFAPDGIKSFEEARARRVVHDGFPVASLRDIIASKRASGREKDLLELELLEDFRQEYERLHTPLLRSATEIALQPPLEN